MRATDAELLARVRQRVRSGEAQLIRERAGLTRSECAGVVQVSREALQKWELGDRSPTGAAALRYGRLLDRLCRLNGVAP